MSLDNNIENEESFQVHTNMSILTNREQFNQLFLSKGKVTKNEEIVNFTMYKKKTKTSILCKPFFKGIQMSWLRTYPGVSHKYFDKCPLFVRHKCRLNTNLGQQIQWVQLLAMVKTHIKVVICLGLSRPHIYICGKTEQPMSSWITEIRENRHVGFLLSAEE